MTEITQAASAKSMTILLVVPADDHAVDGNQAATIVVIEVKDRTTDRRANFLPWYIDAPGSVIQTEAVSFSARAVSA
ncbi:hypothetical protein [Bradyrhizobium sp. RT6a]|jgi:hypothetical protein|uniref:hypothetical protein n=1 Tax=unclassified Bradyrhizobium TaxID=2631580 RepID=UPI003393BE38